MNDLKYSRAFTLCIEALHTLCCEDGDLRSRLSMIDTEFYLLKQEEVPGYDQLQDNLVTLRTSVSKLKQKGNEGRIQATISRSRRKTLEGIAQNVWDIHRKFNTFMKAAI